MARRKIGLVLGSGSSRGWAHIGVIEGLREEHIPIDYIAGCSIGSFMGAIFAANAIESLKNFAAGMKGRSLFNYFDMIFPRSGILDLDSIADLYSMHTLKRKFYELNIPLHIVATDLMKGEKVVLKEGDILTAIKGSMAVPGIFAPVKYGDRWLVDGGLIDPVPIGEARSMGADLVIAVDLNTGLISSQRRARPDLHEEKIETWQSRNEFVSMLYNNYNRVRNGISRMFSYDTATPNILEVIDSSVGIMQERITRINLAVDPPDILIQPRLGDLKIFDFNNVQKSIDEGYREIKKRIPDIRDGIESQYL